ncbi:MAG: hypothetical protein KF861_22430 [Planctomycetaceae bacterium]|nr:hypothetical protein [Planctomycetaceae bacterium]
MSKSNEEHRSRLPFLGIVAMPLIYILSIGPVAWGLTYFKVPFDSWPYMAAMLFYMPLVWLMQAFPFLGDALAWYINLVNFP